MFHFLLFARSFVCVLFFVSANTHVDFCSAQRDSIKQICFNRCRERLRCVCACTNSILLASSWHSHSRPFYSISFAEAMRSRGKTRYLVAYSTVFLHWERNRMHTIYVFYGKYDRSRPILMQFARFSFFCCCCSISLLLSVYLWQSTDHHDQYQVKVWCRRYRGCGCREAGASTLVHYCYYRCVVVVDAIAVSILVIIIFPTFVCLCVLQVSASVYDALLADGTGCT